MGRGRHRPARLTAASIVLLVLASLTVFAASSRPEPPPSAARHPIATVPDRPSTTSAPRPTSTTPTTEAPPTTTSASPTTASSTPPTTEPPLIEHSILAMTRLAEHPLPQPSGNGRRIVYCNSCQRVWLIAETGTIEHTWLVSGRRGVPSPGTYHVFAHARSTSARTNPAVTMQWMTRFAVSARTGNTIGFHAIPYRDGRPLQSTSELGSFRSAGCVRMAPDAARTLYEWAPDGTPVIVTS